MAPDPEEHERSMAVMPNVGMTISSKRTQYILIRLVGQGSFGLVYLAQERSSRKFVSLKVRRP